MRGIVRRAGRGAGGPSRPWWRRPISVTLILAGLFVGLPVAQALVGEIGAVMLGCLVAGFALGRATG
ncbi:hypothetical protein [Roseomonas elaeocarpi]|uniref:Uncharacterized protein n=1 Tax=Roseomonas elaeocarpi TaxID=907779 RepID=A0ABV6JP51_9PROT